MTTTAAVPPEILTAILADAAGRSAAPSEATGSAGVEVVSAEPVRWNDGSLGCPERGRSYTHGQVDGYRVVVRVGHREVDYRVNGRGRFRICVQGGGPITGTFR